jgi:uncharacterized protein (DUF1697 family)
VPPVRRLALLRGINVGGKALIRMEELRACVATLGYEDVRTYIASGNVLFDTQEERLATLEDDLEAAIERRFRLPVRVTVRTPQELDELVEAVPAHWRANGSLRVNVAFLMRGVDAHALAADVQPREGVDEVAVVGRDLGWATRRDALTRSGLQKLISQPVYKELTVRSLKTTLTLQELLRAEP